MALIPLFDRNPLVNVRYHYVTIGLIAVNVVVFMVGLDLDAASVRDLRFGFGMVPSILFGDARLPPELMQAPPLATLVSYQFLHGGAGHLFFNMLYLWVFGDNIEDAMGHVRFLVFYLVCGVLAAVAHGLVDVGSNAPVIGASGAVAGVLGAYFILHPRARIWTLAFWFFPLPLPAVLVLGVFFAQNLWFATAGDGGAGNVAFWAHVGGFLAGAGLIVLFRYRHVPLWHRPASPWRRPRRFPWLRR